MSPQRARLLRRLVPVLLVLGVLLMVVFDLPLTLLIGNLLMLTFIVCGAVLIASPAFLDADADAERGPSEAD